jgi:hypothetical protein
MFSIDGMHYLLCQSGFNNKCQNTLYNIANEIIALKKHVYVDHCMIGKIFEKVSYNLLKFELCERELAKKRPHINGSTISNIFVAKDLYKKDDV